MAGPQSISEIISPDENLLGKAVLVIPKIVLWEAKYWRIVFSWYFSLEEPWTTKTGSHFLRNEVIKEWNCHLQRETANASQN